MAKGPPARRVLQWGASAGVGQHHHHHDNDHESSITLELPQNDSQKTSKHHDHKHKPKPKPTPDHHDHDLGTMGVLVHIISDAANNIGVMAAALVIWLAHYEGRFYADPAASMGIAVMILVSALPIVYRSGLILLESVPSGVELRDVKHDLEKIPQILSTHNLHIWSLNQEKTLATVHVVLSPSSMPNFLDLATVVNECFRAYGVDAVTVQPEVVLSGSESRMELERCRFDCSGSSEGL
ncbi:hypothetical protein MAP00_000493 [Monascus purpureus]|nr:hypothetical protein MAP00_000493 [Monascus purpureus]